MSIVHSTLRAAGVLVALACALLCRAGHGETPLKPVVRTITAFVRLDKTDYKAQIADANAMLKAAQAAFQARGIEVQTIRIATQPFPEYTSGMSAQQRLEMFRAIDAIAAEDRLLVAIGPAMLHNSDSAEQAAQLGEILAATRFISGSVAVAGEDGIHWKAIQASAHLIRLLATHTGNGEGNFRFAAAAMVAPWTPFFPAAYHLGPGHEFSVGLQSAGVAEAAFRQKGTDLPGAEAALSGLLGEEAQLIEHIAQQIAAGSYWQYAGIDLSPAPSGESSIGAAMEELMGHPVGASGSLTVAALITRAVRAIPVKQVGYSGLMLPILEDKRLAQRWSEGKLSIDSVLSYSAVCGTGLDVIPLPGDTSETALAAIVGDVASLAYKWHKPLTARLMPAVGKRAGDMTAFSDPLLTNARIHALSGW